MQGPMTTDGDISVLVSARRVRLGPRCRRPFGSDQKATAKCGIPKSAILSNNLKTSPSCTEKCHPA